VSGKVFPTYANPVTRKQQTGMQPYVPRHSVLEGVSNPEDANPRSRCRQNLESLSNFVYILRREKLTSSTLSPKHTRASIHTLHYPWARHVRRICFKKATRHVGFRRSYITSPYVTFVTCFLPRVAFFCDDAASTDIRTPTSRRNLPSPTTMLYIILPPTTAP